MAVLIDLIFEPDEYEEDLREPPEYRLRGQLDETYFQAQVVFVVDGIDITLSPRGYHLSGPALHFARQLEEIVARRENTCLEFRGGGGWLRFAWAAQSQARLQSSLHAAWVATTHADLEHGAQQFIAKLKAELSDKAPWLDTFPEWASWLRHR